MGAEPGVALFESAAKIHPRQARGRYAKLRVAAMCALLGFYYAVPWIRIGGAPLVWFDLPHRHFHVFGLELVPQDLYLLSWLLLLAALTLFLFTSLAGRLWCGYACPQTVWTEAFLWIERFTEGDRYARIKLDRAPWTAQKIARKSAKHALWAGLGLFTGLTFVAYFIPARELFASAYHFKLDGWPLFWGVFYGFATWGNAGFLREQVCKYMCPYARFQSAMFDRDTLVISYDAARGEPRKSAAKARGAAPADCVDCSLCVQVCPTGIDIREGLQYECIACAACVDVCNGVMDSVGKPHGLIRYSTLRRDAGDTHWRVLRGRTLGYGAIWLVVAGALATAIWLRTPLEFDVMRDRHSLYRELADETVENVYTLKIANQDSHEHVFVLSAAFADGRALVLDPQRVHLAPGEQRAVTLSARAPEAHLPRVSKVQFALAAEDDSRLARRRAASFLSGQ